MILFFFPSWMRIGLLSKYEKINKWIKSKEKIKGIRENYTQLIPLYVSLEFIIS